MFTFTKFLATINNERDLSFTVESPYSSLMLEQIIGYVLTTNNNSAILIHSNTEACIIPAEIVKKYFLTTGDKVTATIAKYHRTVTDIIKVNNRTEIPTNFTKHFDELQGVITKKNIPINDQKMTIGKTAVIVVDKDDDCVKKVQKIGQKLDKDTIKITLSIGGRQENSNLLLEKGCNYAYLTTKGQPIKQQLMISLLSFFRAKELAETGKTVILAINSFDKLLHLMNDSIIKTENLDYKLDNTGITEYTLRDFINIVQSSKAIKNGGSLTILGFFIENESEHSAVILEKLSAICDYTIKMN
jgi:hypothetical protein